MQSRPPPEEPRPEEPNYRAEFRQHEEMQRQFELKCRLLKRQDEDIRASRKRETFSFRDKENSPEPGKHSERKDWQNRIDRIIASKKERNLEDRLRDDRFKEDKFKEERYKDDRLRDYREDRFKEDKYRDDRYREDRHRESVLE